MQKYLFLNSLRDVCIVAFLFGSFTLSAQIPQWRGEGTGYIMDSQNIYLEHGILEMERCGTPFTRIGFDPDMKIWDLARKQNYKQRVDFKFDKETGLKVTKNAVPGGETAWRIETFRIPCKVNAPFVAVDIAAQADMEIKNHDGVGLDFRSTLTWYDKAGKPLSQFYLRINVSPEKGMTTTRTIGKVPRDAASFVITLGFDRPNIPAGKYCKFSGITLSALSKDFAVVPEAQFELMPCLLDKKEISWNAAIPDGTAVKVQIATADDDNGRPGNWSSWHGPDNTEKSFYTKPFSVNAKWCKCRVFLKGSGCYQPILKDFTINGFRQTNWEIFENKYGPLVENLSVSPTHNRREPIVLRITGESPVVWPSFYVHLDNRNITPLFTRKGCELTCIPPFDLKDGLHRIDLVVENVHGERTRSTKYLLVGDSPRDVHRTTVRDDGILLVDGKPVFPIGTYGIWKREFNNFSFDKAFKDLSEAGFNFAQTYRGTQKEYMEFLDTAKKYNMYVWSMHFGINPNDDILQKRITHPAITAWYTGDDTSDNSKPNDLQDRKDMLRALDNCRISVQADHVTSARQVSDYRHYVRGADGFLPEIYPVHDDSPEDRAKSVAEVIHDMDTIMRDIDQCEVSHPKCVWALLQYFQGFGGWLRFPDPVEIRAMIYGAIVHGATGITFYTYGGYQDAKEKNYGITSTPERWEAITTVTRQLRDLEPVLTERSSKVQPKVQILSGAETDAMGQPSVTCLLKRHNGESYIIAVNSAFSTVKASMTVGKAKTAQVLYENRTVKFSGGKMIDEFGPYAVHIYKFSESSK